METATTAAVVTAANATGTLGSGASYTFFAYLGIAVALVFASKFHLDIHECLL